MTSDGPAITSRPLCHACCEDLQRKYDELPRILEVLPAWKGGLRGEIGEAKVSASKNAPPCPLNVGVVDLISDIEAVLYRVGTLPISGLVNQLGGPEWCNEIRRTYTEADATIGISRHWSRRFTPCPDCGLSTLGSWAGEEVITCSSCKKSMDRNQYDKETMIAATAKRRNNK